jgi:hypothetical protein
MSRKIQMGLREAEWEGMGWIFFLIRHPVVFSDNQLKGKNH